MRLLSRYASVARPLIAKVKDPLTQELLATIDNCDYIDSTSILASWMAMVVNVVDAQFEIIRSFLIIKVAENHAMNKLLREVLNPSGKTKQSP